MIDENLTSLAGHPEQTDSSRRPSSSGRSSLNYPISDGNLLPFAGLSTATSRGRVYAWDVRDHPMRLESEAPRQSLPMCPSLLSFCDGSVLPDFGLTGPDQGNPNAIYFDQECPESGFELRSLPIAALGSPMPHGGTTIAAESDIGQRSSSVLSDSGDNATAPRSELPSAPSTPASSPFAAETQDDNPITATQRINHNNAEKKYRMSIKDSFAMLRDSIPSRSLSSHCSNGNLTGDDGKIQGSFRPACKLNKATVSQLSDKRNIPAKYGL